MLRGFILLAAFLPTPTVADVQGLPTRITCATYIDILDADVEVQAAVMVYLRGMAEGAALSNGARSNQLERAPAAIYAVCKDHLLRPLSRVITEHVKPEHFR